MVTFMATARAVPASRKALLLGWNDTGAPMPIDVPSSWVNVCPNGMCCEASPGCVAGAGWSAEVC
jgi:hypothetical protein